MGVGGGSSGEQWKEAGEGGLQQGTWRGSGGCLGGQGRGLCWGVRPEPDPPADGRARNQVRITRSTPEKGGDSRV